MTLNLLPGIGTVIWLLLVIAVGVGLRRESFALWAAILLAIFTEIGIVVAAVVAVMNLSNGLTWDGRPKLPPTTA